VLARFFVVVRTFAPFVAGVANMSYKKFIAFNVLGGATWVGSFMTLGYFFGQLPWVEENFALAMAAVVALSAVPMFVELAKHFFGGKDEDDLIPDVDATIDDIAGSFDEPERVPGGLGA
jgi:membrane-associated protein